MEVSFARGAPMGTRWMGRIYKVWGHRACEAIILMSVREEAI